MGVTLVDELAKDAGDAALQGLWGSRDCFLCWDCGNRGIGPTQRAVTSLFHRVVRPWHLPALGSHKHDTPPAA